MHKTEAAANALCSGSWQAECISYTLLNKVYASIYTETKKCVFSLYQLQKRAIKYGPQSFSKGYAHLFSLLLRVDLRHVFQHIFDINTVAPSRVIDQYMRHGANQLSIL